MTKTNKRRRVFDRLKRLVGSSRYDDEKTLGVPCANRKCNFHNVKFAQSCGAGLGDYGENTYLPNCRKYKPNVKPHERDDRSVS